MKRWVYVKWVRMTTVKNSLFILSRFPFIRYDIQLHIIHMVKFIPWTSVMQLCNRNTRCREYPIISRGSQTGSPITTSRPKFSRNPAIPMVILGISHSMHTLNPESCLHFALKSRIPPFKYNKANLPFCRKAISRPQGAFPWPGKSALGTRLAEKLNGNPLGSLDFKEYNWKSPIPGV